MFWRYPTPRIIALGLTLALGLRVGLARGGVLAPPGLAELGVVLAIGVILWPLQEWWAHQHVLHLRPRQLLGRTFDPDFARRHRAHHRRPWDIPLIMLPTRVVLGLFAPVYLLWWLVMPSTELALAAICAYFGAALFYEWTHYLTHTSVTPRSAWFRRVRRNHRYHHYKSEHYWHAFVVPLVDTIFGTNPRPQEVETSGTARSLGVEDPEDDRQV